MVLLLSNIWVVESGDQITDAWRQPWFVVIVALFLVAVAVQTAFMLMRGQTLRKANQQLRFERLMERLHGDIMAMASSKDLERLLQEVVCEINRIKAIDFELCVVNIIDQARDLRTLFRLSPVGRLVVVDTAFSKATTRFKSIWEQQETVVRRVEEKFLRSYHAMCRELGIACQSPVQWLIDVPFAHGTLSFSSVHDQGFLPREIAVAERLADVVSVGYTRFLEIRELEAHIEARTQEIAARNEMQDALLHISQAVQKMQKPRDLVRVMRVCLMEIQRLHIDAQTMAMHRIVDFERQIAETFRVHSQGLISPPQVLNMRDFFENWTPRKRYYVEDAREALSEAQLTEVQQRLGGLPVVCLLDISFEWGLFSVHSCQPSAFSERDIDVLHEIADIVAIGLRRLEDMEQLAKQNQALQESEDRFRELSEAAYEGIALYRGGLIFDANEQFLRMFGYVLEELAGRDILELVASDHRDYANEQYDAGVEQPYEVDMIRKDGSRFSVEVHGRFAMYDGERVRVGVFRDLTERKQMEEERVRTQRLRAVGELSAGVSHNLNNILTGILGPADLLRHISKDEDVLIEANAIYQSALRARDLVRRLHQAVRTEDRHVEPVDVHALIQEAIVGAQPRWKDEAEMRGVTIDVTRNLNAVPPIRGRASECYDLVLNLLFNAIDAMPDGGRIAISTDVGDGAVVLSVADSGVGMDEATRQRIFEPFFTTKANVGSGLGLATVYGTVSRWGGHIDVESAPGQGTTITLTLPIWDGEAS